MCLCIVKLTRVELLMELHLRAMRCRLPCGSQCYLPPDTSEQNTPHLNSSQRLVLDLPTPRDGRLSLPRWPVTYRDGLLSTDSHPSKYEPGSAWPGVKLATC